MSTFSKGAYKRDQKATARDGEVRSSVNISILGKQWKKKTVLEPERVMGFATEGHARLGVTDRPRREGTARSEIKDRVTQTSSHTPWLSDAWNYLPSSSSTFSIQGRQRFNINLPRNAKEDLRYGFLNSHLRSAIWFHPAVHYTETASRWKLPEQLPWKDEEQPVIWETW